MHELPEMLQGTITQDHSELMREVWLAAEHEEEETGGHEPGSDDDTCDFIVAGCSISQSTCSGAGQCVHKPQAPFHPELTGWSTPPALPVR
jgi:hypothetical protein